MLQTTIRNGAEAAIRERVPFTAGNLHAERPTELGYVGKLPDEWKHLLRVDDAAVGVDYVVYSYLTPIAWVTKDGDVRIPDVKYSVSTSRHQGIVRHALT
jgi:hypothetical protein